jgi:hypothetical protein
VLISVLDLTLRLILMLVMLAAALMLLATSGNIEGSSRNFGLFRPS